VPKYVVLLPGVSVLTHPPDSLFEVYQDTTLIKQVPIKGLHGDDIETIPKAVERQDTS
jgi:hypothetical protein